jgi:hypothetical protein
MVRSSGKIAIAALSDVTFEHEQAGRNVLGTGLVLPETMQLADGIRFGQGFVVLPFDDQLEGIGQLDRRRPLDAHDARDGDVLGRGGSGGSRHFDF